jgi:PD-(D/E)XK nuclease superfamily protein
MRGRSGPSGIRTSVRIVSESTLKGAIAEAAISAAAVELGFVVLRPFPEGRRYDLVIDTGPDLLRVQCKWGRLKGSVIVVILATCRYTPSQGYVRTKYTSADVDGIAVYCHDLKQCYSLPIETVAGRSGIHLRVGPAANNQQTAINFAEKFRFGAIAQLGERVTGSHEVAGSSPASSTSNVRPLW